MNKPAANLASSLSAAAKKQSERSGGVGSTFNDSGDKVGMKKATYLIPAELHRELQLHAVHNERKMSELVIRYIREGIEADQQSD